MRIRSGRAIRGLVLLVAAAGTAGAIVAADPAGAAPAPAVAAPAFSIYDGKLPSYDSCNKFAEVTRTAELRFTTGPRAGELFGHVKLWWSEHCGTNYAQVVLNEPGATGFVEVQTKAGRSHSRAYDGQTSFFSQMIDGRGICVLALGSIAKDRSTGGGSTTYACG
jgi:Protein of unknown function (DUF2690)